jgi:ribosome-binding ATPase YchF (GTP1/OBG family)
MNFQDLENLGSPAKVKEAGRLHLEGRDYLVQDGEILLFRFSR